MKNEHIPKQNGSHMTEGAPETQSSKLRILFLLPIAITITVIVLVLYLMFERQAQNHTKEEMIRIRVSAQTFYEESVQYDARALLAIMEGVKENRELHKALAQRDRAQLLQHSQKLYEGIHNNFNITHFYFTDTNRVNILRVHSPSRHSDTINRATTLQAEKTGRTSYGVELGPLGTFTLRLVTPWYDAETQKLIGYVEIGMEIDQVISKLRNFFNVESFTVIKKEHLKRKQWEDGMLNLGRTPDWEQFEHVVSVEPLPVWTPPQIKELLNNEILNDTNRIEKLKFSNNYFQVTSLPLIDARGENIANMILIADITSEEKDARKTVHVGSVTAVIAGSLLFVFFFFLVGKIESRIEKSEKALQNIANHDGLTGLFNHRYFYNKLQREIIRANRYGGIISLLLLDIDYFKKVNDTYGHLAGDAILREASRRLTKRVRNGIDCVCRYGGEEIMILLPETEIDGANVLAEDIRQLIESEPFEIEDGKAINITVSIGVSAFPKSSKELSELIAFADAALYAAKEGGRNRVIVHGEES